MLTETIDEMIQSMDIVRECSTIDVVILTGAGKKAFCSGVGYIGEDHVLMY
ncbi:MAG: enoyl-CoA hydratase-related protein [Candidatus Walczuchella monophlebidarum]